ncbi:hypothetical protein GYMLUDRAFT_244750 [Collybiopsis luxurians FD-317 M1]|uniref:Unplaced genomic scaffold GYMLUscaffold_29, whole genome shotgun sequence n=1 Tax=Collybiopsis luxurians FD-317 M1 TaxID=944289 RepID=A0A0D0B8T9_9AGAR|nr:hypothetical protein GYMLUDRAFT_244750 [Collybiopsis luxurians FD-317 M1]
MSLLKATTDGNEVALTKVIEIIEEHKTQFPMALDWYSDTLYEASKSGHLDIAKILMKYGAIKKKYYRPYKSATEAAAGEGKVVLVKFLLENTINSEVDSTEECQSVDVNAKGGPQGIPLRAAAINSLDIVKLLVEHGADVNRQYGSALRVVAFRGHLDMVKFLVENNADANLQGGIMALHCKKQPENGADVNIQGGFYGTALQAAAT